MIHFIVLLGMALQTPPGGGGNAAAGRALFEGSGRCASCHVIGDPERSVGPDLGWIGIARTPSALKRSLVDPNDQVFRRYFTVVIETTTGQRIEGLEQREDDRSIEIRDAGGQLKSFLKQDLKDVRREERSLMPSYATLPPAALDDLVAYLRTLRAIPPVEERERTRAIGELTENVAFFDRPGRDAEEKTDAILDALEIPAGATVADVGAGTGYFTWRLAQRVGPNGKVLAVDVQQMMLDRAAEAVRQHGLTNVSYVLGTNSNPRLPDKSVDLVFIAYSYHEFSQPEATMAAIARALKPGGRVFVLEFAKESRSAPAAPTHRMSLEEIRGEIEPLGFELDQMLDFLPMQHGLVYKLR